MILMCLRGVRYLSFPYEPVTSCNVSHGRDVRVRFRTFK